MFLPIRKNWVQWDTNSVIKMMTFACKQIRKDELIRCSFNLNKTEYRVLMVILGKEQAYTVSQVAKITKLERTTIQKAIKDLVSKNLAKRVQKNLPRGGYTFVYRVEDKNEIKGKMKEIIYKWYQSVETEIDRL